MTIQEIRDKHKKEIDEFCKECPHEHISDWMPYCWAPGHCAGSVKICLRCESVAETKNDYQIYQDITITSNSNDRIDKNSQ